MSPFASGRRHCPCDHAHDVRRRFAGSTSGGIKVLRWVLVGKQASREIKRLVHPSGAFAVKLRGKPVPPRVIDAVWGYFTIYIVLFGLLMLLLMLTGVDQVTAWSAIATCMNNTGPGLGACAEFHDHN